MQLKELQLYIINIIRYLGIAVILSESRQDHQLNTIIEFFYVLQVYYLKIKQDHSTRLFPSEKFTNPTQYLFLTIYSSTNTCYGPTTSTEATTNSPLKSIYMRQTDFENAIKDLLYNFDDKLKKSLKETIADQDSKFYVKFEKQIQTL